jgi:hypothetical protein
LRDHPPMLTALAIAFIVYVVICNPGLILLALIAAA